MATKGATATLDVRKLLTNAGYTVSNFTSDECAAIFDKVAELVSLGRTAEQALPIAVSTCTPSKAKPQATGTFEADGVKIRGGAYRWQNTKDGYFTIFDLPLVSEMPKGTKGAPEDVTKAYLEGVVTTAQERYNIGNYCGRAFVGHHKEIELQSPEHVGFVLPNRVGTYALEDEGGKMVDRWTAFGNLKVNTAAFERIRKGELPGTSVELPWSKKRISGVALLGSRPPHFEYANLTLGEEIKDDTSAKFEATADPIFEEDAMTAEELRKIISETIDAKLASFEQGLTAKFAAKADDKKVEKVDDKVDPAKPNPLPVEPGTKTKTEEASFGSEKVAAMFAERDARLAAFEAREKKRDEAEAKRAEEQAKADRILKAEAELKGLILSSDLKKDLATFAHDEKLLSAYVASLKKNAAKEPPATMGDFRGTPVETSDPSVAKFAAMGPAQAEKAAKFAADYREIKRRGWPINSTEEEFVRFQMSA